ncbi:MAG TPA: hypothetical protein VI814_07390 [Candidatus Limnocylindria bacterium]
MSSTRFALEPPCCGAHAAAGVLPGLVVGDAVALALGEGVGDGVRDAAGVVAGAADVLDGVVLGDGEIRTVSAGVQAARSSEVSKKSPPRRRLRPFICRDCRSSSFDCRASVHTDRL